MNAPSAPSGLPLGGSDAVHAVLARLQGLDGLVAACLVEPDSAFVLDTVVGKPATDADSPAEAGDDSLVAATVSAAASDVVQVIGLMTSSLGDPDELEDVTITFGRRHHLITPLPEAGVDGLLVVVTLDRARTNLALARQQLRALGPLLRHATQPPAIEPGHGS
ncbi:hypothetical protein [Kineosporia succinea]|uniref:Roadblock/LAMTOR2 domain-containing protein n=1 Tax=Kineosporia succinea TaxID=84632 RepID=A0ABT9P1X6_9ACTN|nr:hypothetical protein [Kineosporia succinea]MDP9826100.1 hypothetical protein [Kineosporia succinea]